MTGFGGTTGVGGEGEIVLRSWIQGIIQQLDNHNRMNTLPAVLFSALGGEENIRSFLFPCLPATLCAFLH